MQLSAIKTDGVLQWTGVENDFAAELALDLDENTEDVQMTLMFLENNGLIETSDNINYFLPYAVENTGKEGASAERVRAFRERQTQKLLQSNTDVTACNTEIEIEKEIKKELKKEIYKEFAAGDSELLEALKEFDSFRKKLKKPLTDKAQVRLVNKLQKFPREDWVAILQKSVDKGWTDIYPLDNKQPAKQVNRTFEPTVF